MLLMTPVLALILALFIRGKNALMFDHMVLSLYSHAVGFAIIGLGIIAAQLGLAFAFPISMGALGIYSLMALKRAYGRGWIKTVWTTAAASFIYFTLLVTIVLAIVVQVLIERF